jgi:hypothetical protein
MAITRSGLTNSGRTTHYQFEYDDFLTTVVGQDRTNALIAVAESDYTLMTSWFPGVTPFKPPRKVQVLQGFTGGEWGGMDGDDVRLKEEDAPVNELRYLLVSEVTEMFMKARNNGWFASNEGSRGEALSRFLGIEFQLANGLGGMAPSGFGLTSDWLNSNGASPRQDFISTATDDIKPDLRNGCGTLFLFFLHDQLGFSINQIINAGSKTLADVFTSLTGRGNAFTEFRSLIDAHHPVGVPVTPSGESIFPVVDLVSFSTLNQVTAGHTDTTIITLTGTARADFTIALSSADPSVIQVPPTISVTPGVNQVPVLLQTAALQLAKPVTVNITATYAGRTITLPVTVAPPRLTSVLVNPATVVAGKAAAGLVSLNFSPIGSPARVQLSSSSPGFASVDREAAIQPGYSSSTFHVQAIPSVLSFAPAHVTIEASYAGSSASTVITVNPSVVTGIVQSVTLIPTSVTGGQSCSGLVQLQAAVTVDTVVGLAAMEPGTGLLTQPGNLSTVATVQPGQVTILAGNTTAQFSVATKVVAAIRKANIVAGTSAAGALTQKSATLTITP